MAQHLGKRKPSFQAASASGSSDAARNGDNPEKEFGNIPIEEDDASESIHEAAAEFQPRAGSDFIAMGRSSDWALINGRGIESGRVVVMVSAGLPARFRGACKLNKNASFSNS